MKGYVVSWNKHLPPNTSEYNALRSVISLSYITNVLYICPAVGLIHSKYSFKTATLRPIVEHGKFEGVGGFNTLPTWVPATALREVVAPGFATKSERHPLIKVGSGR